MNEAIQHDCDPSDAVIQAEDASPDESPSATESVSARARLDFWLEQVRHYSERALKSTKGGESEAKALRLLTGSAHSLESAARDAGVLE